VLGQLVTQSLILDAQALSLLLGLLHLVLEHDAALNGDVVLGLQVLQRGRLVARLLLKIVVLHLHVAHFELQGSVAVAEGRDFLLQSVLGVVCLGLGLLVLGLRSMLATARCEAPSNEPSILPRRN
jgi:hypothetical protein